MLKQKKKTTRTIKIQMVRKIVKKEEIKEIQKTLSLKKESGKNIAKK
jgi:hypothetical protein